MELTIYDIIKGPIISNKAYKLNRDANQLVLEVHQTANKPMVKDALEKLFDVKVKKVRIKIDKWTDSRVALKRFKSQSQLPNHKRKIAYITLAPGHSINIFEQPGSTPEAA